MPAFAFTPAPARSPSTIVISTTTSVWRPWKLIVRSPLVLLGLEGKYDVVVRVSGGGVSGQAGAIRHGLSRALLQQSDENRSVLKKAGFLTRDPRMKERKKYGLKAARVHPSSPSADLFQMYLYGSASAEPFFLLRSCAQKEHPRAFGPGVFCCDRKCQVEEESIFCSWVLAR